MRDNDSSVGEYFFYPNVRINSKVCCKRMTKMASDDQPEMSLFCRIRDCVLTELRRGKGQSKNREPCKSRDLWDWGMKKKISEKNDGASKTDCSSADRSSTSGDDTTDKCQTRSNGISEQRDIRQSGDDGINNCHADESPNNRFRDQHKCTSSQYCPIKMQNPEAPVCRESEKTRWTSPGNAKKLQPMHQSSDKSHTSPSSLCNKCAATYRPGCDEQC